LVEPPMPPSTRIAFSKALARQNRREAHILARHGTISRPLSCAILRRCASTAGAVALKGRARPMASIMQAMVEALPMVMQVPGVRDIPDFRAMKSSNDSLPRARPR